MQLRIKKRDDVDRALLPGDLTYELDGLDIGDALRELTLEFRLTEVNTATIKLIVDDADIDTDALASIQAYVDARSDADKLREAAASIPGELVDDQSTPQ